MSNAEEGFAFRSARDLALAYRAGRTTPSEVAERALLAIEAIAGSDPPLRAFLSVHASEVRAQAEASSARYRAGAPLGPLDGVPVAVKDDLDVRGHPSTHGSALLGREPAVNDALAVARLRGAGALIVGKTNMHEFGAGPSGANPHHGAARNPYDPARDTGGSSSGSAAAVAAGVVPIALGTDSGGSLRVPAALCGVASIKPTYGLVPTEGVTLRSWSLQHLGPIGASVSDLALALAVLCNESRREAPAMPRRLRLGVCERWWSRASPAVASVAREALARLLASGAEAHAVDLPHIDLARPVMVATFGVEGAVSLEPYLAASERFGPSARLTFEIGRGLPATTFVRAQRARALVARDFDEALARVDALVTPTTAVSAPIYSAAALGGGEIDEALIDALTCYTMPVNLAGLPAAQVPCGYDAEGMPVGLQFVTARGADALALALAAEVEGGVRHARPRVWFDLLAPLEH